MKHLHGLLKSHTNKPPTDAFYLRPGFIDTKWKTKQTRLHRVLYLIQFITASVRSLLSYLICSPAALFNIGLWLGCLNYVALKL